MGERQTSFRMRTDTPLHPPVAGSFQLGSETYQPVYLYYLDTIKIEYISFDQLVIGSPSAQAGTSDQPTG